MLKTKFANTTFQLIQQYPVFNATWGTCRSSECSNAARTPHKCSECLTQELGELVGHDIAQHYDELLRETRHIYTLMYEALDF